VRMIVLLGGGLAFGGQAAHATACDTGVTGSPMHCRGAGGGRTSKVIDIPSYRLGFDQYGCNPGVAQPGPERITAFSCDEDSFVRLEVRDTECDVDAFVVDATCSLGGSCRASNIEPHDGQPFDLTFFCVAGTDYYVIVEGWGPSQGVLGGCPLGQEDVNGNGTIQAATEVGYRSNFSLVPYCTEQCGDGFDNDRDLLFDCNDPDCFDEPPCAEDCFTPGDDDGNGLADCHDPACEPCEEDCAAPGDEDMDGLINCFDPDCDDTEVCCDRDQDGDFADLLACSFGGDCDDEDPDVGPSQVELPANGADEDCDGVDDCYLDEDLDGFGVDEVVRGDDLDCTNLPDEADNASDCDDGDSSAYPGATELVGDGLDQDCNGVDRCYVDADGDGVGGVQTVNALGPTCAAIGRVASTGDCDDLRPDLVTVRTWYGDLDRDGFAGELSATEACAAPVGFLAVATDCDDTTDAVFPGADERCNGRDDDCDGLVDDEDELASAFSVFPDVDGDGHGDPTAPVDLNVCSVPDGYTAVGTDCDDLEPLISPDGIELPYDGIDQDCDGADLRDVDGDGYEGNGGPDCMDRDPGLRPGVTELPDGIDQDCDGLVDEGTVRFDDDGDGFTELGGDCADLNPLINPAATESCDGADEDCDGAVDEGTFCFDDDGDGVTEQAGDCHDGDARVFPGALEAAGSGLDTNCDGVVPEADADGDGWAVHGGDCDDGDALISPAGEEISNSEDDDCDGLVDEGGDLFDDDGDGFSEALGDCDDRLVGTSPLAAEVVDNGRDDDCDGLVDEGGPFADDDGDGFTEYGGDCDDGDRSVYPGAEESGNGVDDDCDGRTDEGVDDVDLDGWTAAQGDCNDSQGWSHPEATEVCDQIDNDCDGEVDEGCASATGPPADPTSTGSCGQVQGGEVGGRIAILIALLAVRRRTHRS
jgi:hypothetical protein